MKHLARALFGIGMMFLFSAALLAGMRFGTLASAAEQVQQETEEEEPPEEEPVIPVVVEDIPEPEPDRRPMPILMYHDIVADGYDYNDMTVTPSKLRSDFTYLRDHGYTPVLPRELLDPENLPEKPVLITFDDGYASNYNHLFPILKEFKFKAVISVICWMADNKASHYCSWTALREMADSGLVEIGSHTYNLHNPDNSSMNYPKGHPNGIQRRHMETDEEFQTRVLDDIRKSYQRITEEIGVAPVFFAYPFGAMEPDAEELIDRLFPVSAITLEGTANLADGLNRMPRWTITMEETLVNFAG